MVDDINFLMYMVEYMIALGMYVLLVKQTAYRYFPLPVRGSHIVI
jgi:hypothetical protein